MKDKENAMNQFCATILILVCMLVFVLYVLFCPRVAGADELTKIDSKLPRYDALVGREFAKDKCSGDLVCAVRMKTKCIVYHAIEPIPYYLDTKAALVCSGLALKK